MHLLHLSPKPHTGAAAAPLAADSIAGSPARHRFVSVRAQLSDSSHLLRDPHPAARLAPAPQVPPRQPQCAHAPPASQRRTGCASTAGHARTRGGLVGKLPLRRPVFAPASAPFNLGDGGSKVRSPCGGAARRGRLQRLSQRLERVPRPAVEQQPDAGSVLETRRRSSAPAFPGGWRIRVEASS